MRHTITQFVYMSKRCNYNPATQKLEEPWLPEIRPYKLGDRDNCVFIGEQQFSVEAPDDFNPIPAQVAALEAEKREALAEYHASVAKINVRLSKLLAITNEVAA